MIEVKARRRKTGWKIAVEGHAGAGEKGHDLICAAASMLVQGLAYHLRKQKDTGLYTEMKDGKAEVFCSPEADAAVAVILDAFELLEKNYPGNVKVVQRMEGNA